MTTLLQFLPKQGRVKVVDTVNIFSVGVVARARKGVSFLAIPESSEF